MNQAAKPKIRAPGARRALGDWSRGQFAALAALVAGSAGLAWVFAHFFPTVTDDGRLYLQLADNLLHTGRYVRFIAGHWQPSTARLPGYPLLLAVLYRFLPGGRLAPLFFLQWLLLLGTAACAAWLAALTGSRRKVALVAFGLVALCPFLAMYAAAVLTEVPATFCTTLAVCCALQALRSRRNPLAWWALCGVALAAGIQLRPDTGLALVVLSLPLFAAAHRQPAAWTRLVALYAIALLPMGLWTLRNWSELHVFRPLVTAEATEVGEAEHPGFDRWTLTWLAGYRGVEDVLDNVPDAAIDVALLPPRALGHKALRARTLAVIAAYNQGGYQLTPALDRQFADLASARIRRRPLRYYAWLPLARMSSLWFSPRIEILPIDDHWWPPAGPWQNDRRDFLFTCGYLLLNAAYLGLALWGLLRARPRFSALLLTLVVSRTVLLSAYPSCEPRYVLEVYPVVLVWAAQGIGLLI